MSALTGTLLAGTYRVGTCLGQGGMGAVYEGIHEGLGRRVAIKVLLDQGALVPEALTRFQREAIAAAQLGHPNIIQVTDFRSNPGEPPFIVMERLDGESMENAIRREGRLAPARVARIAKQVLEALVVAHRAGIVHRDIKPANLFLTQIPGVGEVVKVIDFGIAKLQDGKGTNLTAAGASMGTPLYAAPELLWGTQSDARADIYSLGATMYHALSGRPPIVADTLPQFLTMVRETFPAPIHQEIAGLDPQLAQVVMFSLAKEAVSRYPSAEAMRDALQAVPSVDVAAVGRISNAPTAPTAALPPMQAQASAPSYGSAAPTGPFAQTGTPQPYAVPNAPTPGVAQSGSMSSQQAYGSAPPHVPSYTPAAQKSSIGLWLGLGGMGLLLLLGGGALAFYFLVYAPANVPKPVALATSTSTSASASASAPGPTAPGALATTSPTADPSGRSVIVIPPPPSSRGSLPVAPTAPTVVPTAPPAPSVASVKKMVNARCNLSGTNDTYKDATELRASFDRRQAIAWQCGQSACYSNPITDRHENDNQYYSANYTVQVTKTGAVSGVSPMGSDSCPPLDQCVRSTFFATPLATPLKAGPIQVSCYFVRTR